MLFLSCLGLAANAISYITEGLFWWPPILLFRLIAIAAGLIVVGGIGIICLSPRR